MGSSSESHLSESWHSDREGDDAGSGDEDVSRFEADVAASRAEESFTRSSSALIESTSETLTRSDRALRELSLESDSTFSESSIDPNDIRPPDVSAKETEIKDLVESVLKEIAKAEKEKKKSATRRWIYASVGVMAAAGLGLLLYNLIQRYANDRGADDLPVPDDVKNAVQELVTKWQTESDGNFWTDFANVIDTGLVVNGETTAFTIADQVVFLNCVVETNPLRKLWLWDTSEDTLTNAKAIKAFYDRSKKVSDIYRNVTSVTYKDQSMPRSIAAYQLKTVLGWILLEHHEKAAANATVEVSA